MPLGFDGVHSNASAGSITLVVYGIYEARTAVWGVGQLVVVCGLRSERGQFESFVK